MDGRGRCLDNIFIERLWRSLKYEEVYLQDYTNGAGGSRRHQPLLPASTITSGSHQSLDYRTPADLCRGPERAFMTELMRKKSFIESGDSAPKPPGFIAFPPEMVVLVRLQ